MKRLNWSAGLVALLFSRDLFADTVTELPSYGWLLTKTVLVLVGVCLLAFASLRWLSKIQNRSALGKMQVLAKLPLEPRRSVFVVKVGQRGLIIGTSESGMSSLGELTPNELVVFETHDEPVETEVGALLENA